MKIAPEKHGIMAKNLIQHIESNNQANADSFLGSLEFSEKEIDNVASLAKKQWQCKEWYVHKRGFITASKDKNVYTRQISAERQPETEVSALVKSLTQQKDVSVRQNIMEDPKILLIVVLSTKRVPGKPTTDLSQVNIINLI